MAAIVDVLIRGKYEADMAFISLQNAIKISNDSAGKAVDKLRGWTDGFMNIKAGWDMAAGAAQAAYSTMQQVYNATITETVEYAAQVRNLSMTIGASAEESSKLIQAADDMGISFDTLSQAMEGAIRKGAEPSIDGIAKLADQYNAIQDPIARVKFLMDTFGRSGADLKMLMQEGSSGIRELGVEAEKAGLVMGQDAVQAARDYEIASDGLNDRLEAVKIKIGNQLIPVVSGFIDALTETEDEVQQNNMAWTRHIPVLGGVIELFGLTANAIENSADKSKAAAAEIENAHNRLSSLSSSIPVVGHGTSYKHGEGPAYPYSEQNPSGYVLDRTGQRTYPGRATGVGAMVAGVPYLVNEGRPEVFTPSTNGSMTPVASMGGSDNLSVTVQINQPFGLQDQLQAENILRPAIRNVVREMKQDGTLR
jgi:transcriptional regulator with XRE-family HTH domain